MRTYIESLLLNNHFSGQNLASISPEIAFTTTLFFNLNFFYLNKTVKTF